MKACLHNFFDGADFQQWLSQNGLTFDQLVKVGRKRRNTKLDNPKCLSIGCAEVYEIQRGIEVWHSYSQRIRDFKDKVRSSHSTTALGFGQFHVYFTNPISAAKLVDEYQKVALTMGLDDGWKPQEVMTTIRIGGRGAKQLRETAHHLELSGRRYYPLRAIQAVEHNLQLPDGLLTGRHKLKVEEFPSRVKFI